MRIVKEVTITTEHGSSYVTVTKLHSTYVVECSKGLMDKASLRDISNVIAIAMQTVHQG